MSNTVISVENLGKRYSLGPGGHSNERYTALRDVISHKARSLFRPSAKTQVCSGGDSGQSDVVGLRSSFESQVSSQDFWALKDVSFDIQQGEVVGIIGRNGAGKSTLLKILSRITDPTKGKIKIKGRVASLLEVGTGFHPELTGRENIYLNGAILGMSRAEIRTKFDEIVAFAEVEKFLDTPVKRYSSGMYVRLAFAVAAHLEPEILIVDEVLAVGDAEFQRKCLGKMQDVAGHGRTVIFVSHNLGSISQLCTQAILLSQGQVICAGNVLEVTNRYLNSGTEQWADVRWDDLSRAPGDSTVRLTRVRAINALHQSVPQSVDVKQSIGIEFNYCVLIKDAIFTPSLHLYNAEGVQIFLTIDLEEDWLSTQRETGVHRSIAWIPGNFLNIGMHYFSVALSRLDTNTVHLFERQVIAINVLESSDDNTSRGPYPGHLPGIIRPILKWETTRQESLLIDLVRQTQ